MRWQIYLFINISRNENKYPCDKEKRQNNVHTVAKLKIFSNRLNQFRLELVSVESVFINQW